MAADELDLRLQARARRAYELGRLLAALRLALSSCRRRRGHRLRAAVPGDVRARPALLLLSVGLGYAGGPAGRAVVPVCSPARARSRHRS